MAEERSKTMVYEDKLKIIKKDALTDKEKMRVDQFILSENTNGEFINSLKFLEYHPEGRFIDDSIIVVDACSNTIRGLMMAAQKQGEPAIIVSHPGTTFAGPIIDRKLRIQEVQSVLDVLLTYYEKKYEVICVKTVPMCYMKQYYGIIDYFLLKRGYVLGMSGLSNVINISNIETEDDILKMFSSKRRNQVRKVIRGEKYIFEEKDNIEEEIWQNLNSNLQCKYNAKATHTYEEIIDLRLRYSDRIKVFCTLNHLNVYGAFGLVFKFKNVFHTQYLDVNYEHVGEYPNLFLIMNLIKVALRENYKYFSFGVSTEDEGNVLNTSLYDYKAQFGGGDIILPNYIKKQKF